MVCQTVLVQVPLQVNLQPELLPMLSDLPTYLGPLDHTRPRRIGTDISGITEASQLIFSTLEGG